MLHHFSHILTLISIFTSLVFFSSCNTHKKLVYFQEEIPANSEVNTSNYTPTFKTDDLLSIIITGDDPLSAVPFNLTYTGQASGISSGYTTGNTERTGYLIDEKGTINMPVIGRLSLKGLTRSEATDLIEQEMVKYIENPIVNIQILNFKVSILGDVKKPGTYKIPNERITLLEAIGLSGDLNITGNRKNVLIIRDNDGEKKEIRVDLTTADLFSSEAFYLQQNDVVYVEPNNAKRSSSTMWKTTGGIFISLTALVITTVTLIVK